MGRLALTAVLAGCSFTVAPGTAIDATVGDDTGDAPDLGPWSAATKIIELSGATDEDDPSLTADLLEIYFASDRAGGVGGEDIWTSQRPAVDRPWSVPTHVAELASPDADSNVKVSADGLWIFFASTRAPSVLSDLWFSSRLSRTAAWTTPVHIPEVNSADGDWGGHPSADLLQLAFCSTRDSTEDLYVASRAASIDVWSAPTRITELVTAMAECDPMNPDASTLYFSSSRAGTVGDYDLFVATRSGGAYGPAVGLGAVNSALRDRDPWVSADHRTLVFASNRDGTHDLFTSAR